MENGKGKREKGKGKREIETGPPRRDFGLSERAESRVRAQCLIGSRTPPPSILECECELRVTLLFLSETVRRHSELAGSDQTEQMAHQLNTDYLRRKLLNPQRQVVLQSHLALLRSPLPPQTHDSCSFPSPSFPALCRATLCPCCRNSRFCMHR